MNNRIRSLVLTGIVGVSALSFTACASNNNELTGKYKLESAQGVSVEEMASVALLSGKKYTADSIANSTYFEFDKNGSFKMLYSDNFDEKADKKVVEGTYTKSDNKVTLIVKQDNNESTEEATLDGNSLVMSGKTALVFKKVE